MTARLAIFLVALVSSLAACAPTPVPDVPLLTLLPTVTPSRTLRILPSPIPEQRWGTPTWPATYPTYTPTPRPATPDPRPTETDTDLERSFRDQLAGCWQKEYSPNGRWAVAQCDFDETHIVDVDGKRTWTISFAEVYGEKFGNGNGVIQPAYWTKDGRYVYLTIILHVSGPLYYSNSWGLLRLDLQTGTTSEILPARQYLHYSVSFSATGKYLAYIPRYTPLILHVVDLKTGGDQVVRIPETYNQAGGFLWAPDDRLLIYEQADIQPADINTFSVVAFNLGDGSTRIIVADLPYEFSPMKWIDSGRIRMLDELGHFWIMNLSDGQLIRE